jgi:hypothetical protein
MELKSKVRETIIQMQNLLEAKFLNPHLLTKVKEGLPTEKNPHKVLIETLMQLKETDEKGRNFEILNSINGLIENCQRAAQFGQHAVKVCKKHRDCLYKRFLLHSQKNLFLQALEGLAEPEWDMKWNDFVNTLKDEGSLVANEGEHKIRVSWINEGVHNASLGLQYFSYPDQIHATGWKDESTRTAVMRVAHFTGNAVVAFYTETSAPNTLLAELFLGHENREIVENCRAVFSLDGRKFISIENSSINPNEFLPKPE